MTTAPHLWEVDHPYYCSDQNYYNAKDTHHRYASWEEFLAAKVPAHA